MGLIEGFFRGNCGADGWAGEESNTGEEDGGKWVLVASYGGGGVFCNELLLRSG